MAPWIPAEAVQALTSMLSVVTPTMEPAFGQAPSWAGGLSTAILVLSEDFFERSQDIFRMYA